jgi:hypothetical protein
LGALERGIRFAKRRAGLIIQNPVMSSCQNDIIVNGRICETSDGESRKFKGLTRGKSHALAIRATPHSEGIDGEWNKTIKMAYFMVACTGPAEVFFSGS